MGTNQRDWPTEIKECRSITKLGLLVRAVGCDLIDKRARWGLITAVDACEELRIYNAHAAAVEEMTVVRQAHEYLKERGYF